MSQPDRQCTHLAVQAHATRVPDAVAIMAPGRAALTYGSLGRQIDQTAATLSALGVGRHDRVALVLPPGPEMALALIAVASAATCAPLNPVLRADEFDFHLSTLNATALIVPAAMDGPIRAVAQRRRIPVLELLPLSAGPAGGFSLTGPQRPSVPRANFARPHDIAFLLPTSGTTSRSKTVPLTHANICVSARNIRSALALGEDDRCLDVMPLFHVHGLMATLASLLAGASVVTPPEFDATRFFGWIDECRPTWYTAVPTIHQAVLDSAASHTDVIARRRLRFIRSSSAALPPSLGAELERVFQAPVVESYGMTEAAHQITSAPLPPRMRKRGSVGVAAGPDVAIMDEAGRLLRAGETGEIVIRGAQVMPGYDGAPPTGPDAFTDGWLRTGDLGYLDADGFVFITGRLKEIINRGGEKISPREIDDVLRDHPAVAQAVTFAVPHPTLGEDVMAAVVLRERASAAEALLRRFVAERLAPFKVPGRVVIVDELPKGATGKVRRRAVAEALGLRTPPENGAHIDPRTPTEVVVTSIWGRVLGVAEVGADDSFFALGGDSIRAALIVSRLREALDVEVSLQSFFETPTVAGVAERIDEARRLAPTEPPLPLSPVPRTDNLPLSFAEQRLWFLDQLEPDSAEYNRAAALRIAGRLDLRALEQSLGEIRRRHEALRTTFPAIAGQPRAVIASAEPFELAVVDLRELPEAELEAQVRRLGADEARLPFDLARGPLFRATLLRTDEEEWVLLLTTHHIVSDGWSTGVLNRELELLYQAFSNGSPSPLPELPIQPVDYASWQRSWLQGEILDGHLAYWKQQLAGSPSRLDVPVDHRRAAAPRSRGAVQPFLLSATLAHALRVVGGCERATLFMTLLAAFQTLLHRYTGQDDIVVGSPVAGRSRIEIEGLIGFFANTVALRTRLTGDPTFRELLGRVREVTLGAYAHQELPFDTLVAALDPERGRDHGPLFHVMFALQNAPRSAPALPGLTVRVMETASGPAKFDLTLSITEDEADLPGSVEYDPDLFDAATIARMLGHFQTLLEGIVAHPDERISRLPLLTDAERHQLVVAWNDTRADYPREACLPELFEAQVARTPDAVAVVAGDERVSYGELNRRANQLAHRLRRLGVGPEALVGICVARSVGMVVGLLGILKAGGAYVPLDPAYPTERLRFMLEDAGTEIILTQRAMVDALPTTTATIICLDTDWGSIAGEPATNPGVPLTAQRLAYVTYTSGSTGRPKGVAIPHRGVVRLLFGQDYVTLDAGQTLLQMAPIAFDASTFELWGALLHGGRCALFPAEPPSHRRLGEIIARHGVTTLWLTASLFNSVMDEAPATLAPIRQLLIGGEALSVPHVRRALEILPHTRIVNGYGPTESTTFTCCYRLPRALDPGAASIPIGRPIANTEVYVVDRHLNPVPIGVPGELVIGGVGLARGYLQRPELTAEKFVAHPFSAEPGARLYRTGDVGRHLADGTIEFLGRFDSQVKIRGYRVEPGEIEAMLRRHPAVQQTVVVASDDVGGGTRLVAYVVATPGRAVTVSELRNALQQSLPEYMVPSAFVMLEALPLNPNGKVDRRTLPQPRPSDLAPERAFVAPRTPIEERVARILADVLALERVGVEDDFFELGGHSLLATRVVSRLREALGVELALRQIFDTPTVAGLAVAIAQTQAERLDQEELARMLGVLRDLSDGEARRLPMDAGS